MENQRYRVLSKKENRFIYYGLSLSELILIFQLNKINLDDVIIDISIGLLDKNKKEIYVNDILFFDDFTDIEWRNGEELRMIVKYCSELCRYVVDFESIYGGEGYSGNDELDQIYSLIKHDAYIGGNLHQNIDLLK